jgi:glycosyltransferase involved in cell wall biosynthesis
VGTVPRTARTSEHWAVFVENRYWNLLGREVVWQPCLRVLRSADLVIVEQASRLLLNYALIARRPFIRQKLAYWGHGANLQATKQDGLSERIKGRLTRSADWWFAYTELSSKIVEKAGYPSARITTVQNTIDTTELRLALDAISTDDIVRTRARLSIHGNAVAIYCGGMYPNKRLDFLVHACSLIKQRLPDFEVIFIGDGPDQRIVENACAANPWMHYVGPVFGPDRAAYFAISQALLMPGLVGLAVLDSLVSGCPTFTTNIPFHSPEIAYLEHGRNGWITEPDVQIYADAVVRYFTEQSMQEELQEGCRASSQRYSLENMVARFGEGVLRCLDAAPAR